MVTALTPRETAVLLAAASGWSQRETAARLHTSRGSVRSAIGTAIAKLGVVNALQAVAVAVRDGLIDVATVPGGQPADPADEQLAASEAEGAQQHQAELAAMRAVLDRWNAKNPIVLHPQTLQFLQQLNQALAVGQ